MKIKYPLPGEIWNDSHYGNKRILKVSPEGIHIDMPPGRLSCYEYEHFSRYFEYVAEQN